MPTNRFFARLAAPATALLVAGAGFAVGGGIAAAGDESCDVLKEAEVERATGHLVTAADPPEGVGGACSFAVEGSPADTVNVWVLEGDEADEGFRTGEQIGGDDADELPKLGEDAVYLDDPLNTAYVLRDGTLVYLQYYVFSGDDTPKQIKKAVVKMTKTAIRRATS